MSLLTLPFRLPFLPVQAVIRLGELIGEQAERELHDPARIRRELEEAQWQQAKGAISEEDVSRIEKEATNRLVTPEVPTVTRPAGETAEEDEDRS